MTLLEFLSQAHLAAFAAWDAARLAGQPTEQLERAMNEARAAWAKEAERTEESEAAA